MKKRLLFALVSIALVLTMLAACSPSPSTSPSDSASTDESAAVTTDETATESASEAPALKIGCLNRSETEEVHIVFAEGLRAACEEAGVELLYNTPGGDDQTAIRSAFDSFITQGCNVIVDFLSSQEISETLAADAQKDGIFYFGVDATLNNGSYFYGLSNGEAGEKLGTYLVDYVANQMGGQCDLVILMDSPSHGEDVAKRTEVPKQMLKDAYPDMITDETVQYLSLSNYELSDVKQKTTDFFTLHSDAQNVLMISFSSYFNDAVYPASMATGFDSKLHYFSYDGLQASQQVLKDVNAGTPSILKGEVCSNFMQYGYDIVALAQKLVAGETIDEMNYVQSFVLTPDNVNEKFPD
jgi:ABC-type sugar transport system substrate-binding protein